MKTIYDLFLNWIKLLRSLEEKEALILVNNLPKYYYTYQYSFFSRFCRLMAMLVIASSWYHIYILQLITYCKKKFNISFVIPDNEEFYLSIY